MNPRKVVDCESLGTKTRARNRAPNPLYRDSFVMLCRLLCAVLCCVVICCVVLCCALPYCCQARASEAKGRIVVFNQQCDWVADPDGCYGITATYRVDGPSQASKVGAVAALVRSLAAESLYTPHTGVQHYQNGVTP